MVSSVSPGDRPAWVSTEYMRAPATPAAPVPDPQPSRTSLRMRMRMRMMMMMMMVMMMMVGWGMGGWRNGDNGREKRNQ